MPKKDTLNKSTKAYFIEICIAFTRFFTSCACRRPKSSPQFSTKSMDLELPQVLLAST